MMLSAHLDEQEELAKRAINLIRNQDLLLRYLTAIRKRRITNDQISREILAAFENDPRLTLAYPARGTTLEPRNVSGKSPSTPEPETHQPVKA